MSKTCLYCVAEISTKLTIVTSLSCHTTELIIRSFSSGLYKTMQAEFSVSHDLLTFCVQSVNTSFFKSRKQIILLLFN